MGDRRVHAGIGDGGSQRRIVGRPTGSTPCFRHRHSVVHHASLFCALAPNIWVLDLARAAQGIGSAVLFACSLALLADVFEKGPQRATALAAYGATIGGAFAVGPLVGGLLTELLDWRAIFF